MGRLVLQAMVLAASLCLMSCAGLPAASADPPATDPVAAYKLGPGDKIRVTTFGEQSLTGEFSVDGSGKISLPLAGEIQAAGFTAPEIERSVATLLKEGGYVRDPKITVGILTYRPFFILGEVQSPGDYPYTHALTVENAVATAKGFTLRANTKRVFIKHAGETAETKYRLTPSTLVAPGDTIRIPERIF
jgi:polysaccharide export outer membrane protein